MSKRLSANYSLWPERSRPRRRTLLASAVNGFAIGVVCVIAAYNAFPDVVLSGAGQAPPAMSDFELAPIFAHAVAAVSLETVNRGSRPRAPAGKVTLPSKDIGSASTTGAATDGRGGAGPARSLATLGSSGNPESLTLEEGHSTPQSISTGADAEEAKLTPTTVHKKTVREKRKMIVREKHTKVVRKSQRPPISSKQPVYNLVSKTAIWY
jgi:hypothetical protein